MKAKYFVIIMAALEFFYGVRGTSTGIAHFAHIGGALFGLLLILYWNYGKDDKKLKVEVVEKLKCC